MHIFKRIKEIYMYENIKKKRIFKNFKSYIYTFFSKIFSQILYIPLMFYFWGVEATGVWIFLTSILNSVNIFNINASEYSFQELILTNKKNIENIYSNSLIITFINSLIISLIFFLLFYFFFSNLDILNSINIKNLFEILISLTIIFFLQNLINFLYIHFYVRGELNFNNYNRELIDLTYKLIIPFSGYMYSDLRILSFFYLILISSNFIYLLFVIKRKSNIHFQIRLINFTQIKKIFYGSLNFNYINLTNIINTSFLNFFIGFFYNAEILALTNALTILFKNMLTRLISIGNEILMFEIPFLSKREKNKSLDYKKFHNKISFFLVIVYLISCFFIGEKIFNYWTLNKFNNYNHLMWVIIFETITFIAMNNYLNIFKALNILKGLSIKILIITIFSYFVINVFQNKYMVIELIFITLSIKNILILFFTKFFYSKRLKL